MTIQIILQIDIQNKGDFYRVSEEGKEPKLVGSTEFAVKLLKNSFLKYMRLYPSVGKYFVYSYEEGYYKSYSEEEIMILLFSVLQQFDEYKLLEPSYINKLFAFYKKNINVSKFGTPIYDNDYICLQNGILNIKTLSFEEFTPDRFITYKLSFKWDPSVKHPIFDKYINEFCEGYTDRKDFLQSVMSAIIHQDTHLQYFLQIVGPGSTGKSTFGSLLTCLVGKEATITTSLKSLNSDPFEVQNLLGKKLILLSDAERYFGDLSILKQIVGGDALRGRAKFIQGNFEVNIQGTVVLISNFPLMSKDTSNAIHRRLRTFPANFVVNSTETLLTYYIDRWEGLLVKELPGILNWVLNAGKEKIKAYIANTLENVPSLIETSSEDALRLNPILAWIKDEVKIGSGSFLGYKSELGEKARLEALRRRALFPFYYDWCKRQGIEPIRQSRYFLEALLTTLRNEGYEVEKIRKGPGIYISGIELRESVFSRDYSYGAPYVEEDIKYTSPADIPIVDVTISEVEDSEDKVDPLIKEIKLLKSNKSDDLSNKERKEKGKDLSKEINKKITKETFYGSEYIAPVPRMQHPSLYPDIYNSYIKALDKSSFKETINKASKVKDPVVNFLTEKHIKDAKIGSPDYKNRVKEMVEKALISKKSFGIIPYSYKTLGNSPRIIPKLYGNTTNNAKKIVRDYGYSQAGKLSKKLGYTLVDFDISSCYMSVLIGLFSDPLRCLQKAIETIGIWNFIKEEFKSNNREKVFNKSAVKICVYSSFFQGGDNAMIEGIMENFRKDLGVQKPEFKNLSFYEEMHNLAKELTREMQSSSVILDIRDLSSKLLNLYEESDLIGPTGHSYRVTKLNFKNVFPNYLQSFEFALLAHATLKTKDKYNIEIIGHYHDGNVLAFKDETLDEAVDYMMNELTALGYKLGLNHPQKLEIRCTYPNIDLDPSKDDIDPGGDYSIIKI
jgi:P4 family phage/plasmid primase-like protien